MLSTNSIKKTQHSFDSMAPKSRVAKSIFDGLVCRTNHQHICASCRTTISKSRYASTATAQATEPAPPISQLSSNEPAIAAEAQPRILVNAGVVVSRPPLLTPDPHPFETAFYLYQRRLNERLVLPFTQYFHYKKGTPAFEHWRTKRRERGGAAARDIGKYNAYTPESWNDEVLVGDETGTPAKIVEQLLEEEGRQAEFAGDSGNIRLAGLKRSTVADETKDTKSLERSLSRTLYLLVRQKQRTKGAEAQWRFPSGALEVKESLKEAAERILTQSCGPNMNTWFIAGHPIGHHIHTSKQPSKQIENKKAEPEIPSGDVDAEKTFFMKARIFAGQVDLKDNKFSVQQYKWLAKEEIEKHVDEQYWSSIKNMLVEQ